MTPQTAQAQIDALERILRLQDFLDAFTHAVGDADWPAARDAMRNVVVIAADMHRTVGRRVK